MRNKLLRLVSVSAILVLLLAACGGDDDQAAEGDGATPTAEATDDATTAPADDGDAAAPAEDQEPVSITIGWTPPDITGVFQTATDFFERSAEQANQAGFDVEIVSRSPATHQAFADQLSIVEDFITQQVDVIAISPADTEALRPGIQQANDAGIPVIMVNLLEEQEGVDIASFIGFDNREAAAVSAYAALDYFGGPGVLGEGEQVDEPEDGFLDLEWWQGVYEGTDVSDVSPDGVIIEGIAGTFFSNARLEGYNGVLDQHGSVEILAEPLAGDWNRETGTAAAETFLERFGQGELDFIWAASNEMGIGASQAAERSGRLDSSGGGTPPGDGVAIFTNDVTPESVDMIREGLIIAETHHGFSEWGWFGTEFGVRIACGLDVPQFQDIRPRTVWEGNAGQFYPDPALPEIDWEQIRADCQR